MIIQKRRVKLIRLFKILSVSLLVIFAVSCQKTKRHLAISKIRGVAKLSTTETIIDKVVVGEKGKKLFGFINLGNAEFVAYSEATVKTGIDLTKLKPRDVKINGDMIEVNLPAIEVLDFQYPFEKFRIDENLSDNDVFVRNDVIDQEFFFRQAELDIRKHLKYTGIIKQTESNTRKILEGLLFNLGYNEVYVSFKESKVLIQQVKVDESYEERMKELK